MAVYAFLLLNFRISAAQDVTMDGENMGDSTTDKSMMMTPPEGYDGHHICWMEIGFKDQPATVEFYEELFGWKFIPYESMENYVFFQSTSGVMGGFNGNGFGQMQNVIFYLYVPDIDSALAEIETAGGKTLVPKTPVDTFGNIALFTDPSGVTVGLSDIFMGLETSPNPFGEGDKPAVNTICSFEIYGGDFAKTREFYSKLFGWTVAEDSVPSEYMHFASGGGADGVFQSHTPDAPVVAYVWVDDVAATLAKVKELDGATLSEATPTPMGVFGYFTDPSGVWIGLIGTK